MTFSVLLPTRNRLELLRYAVETVRRQDRDDWEIVISDNASTDDVVGYVASLDDPRIRCVRSERFLPVTENWNNALENCRGDWVVMLGDDDGLVAGYFARMERLIERHRPDLIYAAGLLFAYPGVIPDTPQGFLRPYRSAGFFGRSTDAFLLPHSEAVELVRRSMRLEMAFTYNMQHTLVSRSVLDRMKQRGPVFQSPYPDFYATNAMFLVSERILIDPTPEVIVGISPRSYGFFHFNQREKEGVETLLNNAPDAQTVQRLSHQLLPGSRDRSSWLLAMEAVSRNFGKAEGLSPDYSRYRFLQIFNAYVGDLSKKGLTREDARDLWRRLRWSERLFLWSWMRAGSRLIRIFPRERRQAWLGALWRVIGRTPAMQPGVEAPVPYQNLLEVFERVTAETAPRH